MKIYVDKNALQDYTTKLIAKEKTIFATKNEVGSPLVASTVAGMTDHDKIYVYVGSETGYTSGNWYYWDGSAWVSGGIYNSEGFVLDDTLTSATLPAQAKAVGDKVNQLSEDLKNATVIKTNTDFNTIAPSKTPYYIFRASGHTNTPPVEYVNGLMFCNAVKYNSTSTYINQVFIHGGSGAVFIRLYNPTNETWSAWQNVEQGLQQLNVIKSATDFNEIAPSEKGYYIFTASGHTNTPDVTPKAGYLECKRIVYDSTRTYIVQNFIHMSTGALFTRLYNPTSGTWGSWNSSDLYGKKEISILFIGNSLTQDGIAYLPYLLKNYYPEVDFKFYMWYNGGYTLSQQYTDFENNAKADNFAVAENKANWTTYSGRTGRTMSEVLSSYKFDVVCMQEYFNFLFDSDHPYTDTQMITDWNNCRDYITSHYTGGNGLEFVSLFHAPLRDNNPNMPSGESSASIFARTVAKNNYILQHTISDDMIPNGIAVFRALSTSLDSLGDQGHLSPDCIHTQEGLPCLIQTFVAACWVLNRLAINKSVYGCPLRMTTEIYNTINVPGANLGTGVITGTDAQNLLAQEIAIKAYKEGKYYVENNIFSPGN